MLLPGSKVAFHWLLDSPPYFLVNRVLLCEGAVKGWILAPASGDIAQIALADSRLAEAEAASQGFDCHFVQALALFPGRNAKGGIEMVRHVANRILHTGIVGGAGIHRKQISRRLESTRGCRRMSRCSTLPHSRRH